MRPQVVGGACHRVQQALDGALAEGALRLPPELRSHVARCPRCGPEVAETEGLLARLRGAAAGIDMSRVPRVVDYVMARTAAGAAGNPAGAPGGELRRRPDFRWVLGQIAAVAAVMVIAVGGVTYSLLKVNQALSGITPSQVADRLAAPFREAASALFHNAR